MVAALRAADHWKPEHGTPYHLYASVCVKNSILTALNKAMLEYRRRTAREADNSDLRPVTEIEGKPSPDWSFYDELRFVKKDAGREVLIDRFVNCRTLEQIGEDRGVTRERIRQIEERAIMEIMAGWERLVSWKKPTEKPNGRTVGIRRERKRRPRSR
jgi:DNA-directed RNA polymerase specialized sigma subunit